MQTLESILDTSIKSVDGVAREVRVRELMEPGWPFPYYNTENVKRVLEQSVTVKGKKLYLNGEILFDEGMRDLWPEKWDANIWKEIDTIVLDKKAGRVVYIHGRQLVGGKNCPSTFVSKDNIRLSADSYENINIKSSRRTVISLNFWESKTKTYFKNVHVETKDADIDFNHLNQLEQIDVKADFVRVTPNDDANQPHVDEDVLKKLKLSPTIKEIAFNLISNYYEFVRKGNEWVEKS